MSVMFRSQDQIVAISMTDAGKKASLQGADQRLRLGARVRAFYPDKNKGGNCDFDFSVSTSERTDAFYVRLTYAGSDAN